MKNVFDFRKQLIDEYEQFSRSFTKISASDIKKLVDEEYRRGRYWPEALVQINPNYERALTVSELAGELGLHPLCEEIFTVRDAAGEEVSLRLFRHQQEAFSIASKGESFVVTTGTGSGKSLAFFLPIFDRILKAKEKDPKPRTRALIVYPMNALANSQEEEVRKYLSKFDSPPLTVARYTGQTGSAQRREIADNPPDILLTNYMMLELILTRFEEVDRQVVENCVGLEFLVLDELHTYRGRQGADVALLVRRLRERFAAEKLICIGTSATMSSTGTREDQKKTVADVATKLFGQEILPTCVIGETLARVTSEKLSLESVRPQLRESLSRERFAWKNEEEFVEDPVAVWVELTLGLSLKNGSAPERAKPISLSEAAEKLASEIAIDSEMAKRKLEEFLIAAQSFRLSDGRSPFAFKLHQFISGPGRVYCTLEEEGKRHVTLDAQKYAPNRQEEEVLLYGAHFCRECGQEYHPVWDLDNLAFSPREIDDTGSEDNEIRPGFLMPIKEGQAFQGKVEDYPENWLEPARDGPKLRSFYRKLQPEHYWVAPDGKVGSGKRDFWFIPGKFRFCLNCSELHEAHGRDINRLSGLSGEGRSSATTMLTLSMLRQLFAEEWGERDLNVNDPRKLLGFADNRQDSALQAGHFNDFLALLILRAGLIGALQKNGGVLEEKDLGQKVFKALGFDSEDPGRRAEYLENPNLVGFALNNAQEAVRFVISYRLLRDLRKGWRYNNPNLSQLHLLRIDYHGLSEFCANDSHFSSNSIFAKLTPEEREAFAKVVFDEMLKNLSINSRFLSHHDQEQAKSDSYLTEHWSIRDEADLARTTYLILDRVPQEKGRPRRDLVGGGPRSRLVRLLRNAGFWKNSAVSTEVETLKLEDFKDLLESFLTIVQNSGYVEKRDVDRKVKGCWVLNSDSLRWTLTTEDPGAEEKSQNRFFRQLYLAIAEILKDSDHHLFDFEAHEHTAQVKPDEREILEQRFRRNERDFEKWKETSLNDAPMRRLPVLYCSPTMELGIDIASLNTVYLRNIPPTPANYAQRSGRAGRSGQAALVVTYCASMSPHDQWFFHHASDMVHGIVRAPTLELSNEDLVKSHLHAIWLSNLGYRFVGIKESLDLEADKKPIIGPILEKIRDFEIQMKSTEEIRGVLAQIENELTPENAPWYAPGFAESVVKNAEKSFSEAFDRWRTLYEAVLKQLESSHKIMISAANDSNAKHEAQFRYNDAVRQQRLLVDSTHNRHSDFYIFRYLASQGFLPGYNFPRLPLMAWIPAQGKTRNSGEDEGAMVIRPRFLALSEFGPLSLIYHQGRTFRVERIKLSAQSTELVATEAILPTANAYICNNCGYGHIGTEEKSEPTINLCEQCNQRITEECRINSLYRIETVETRARERISINEEERQRQGYELQTTYRFIPKRNGQIEKYRSAALFEEEVIADLLYAPAAQISRINKGWRRRKHKEQYGFNINPLNGRWVGDEEPGKEKDSKEDQKKRDPVQRIVPYVEDYRNILIFTPKEPQSEMTMATLETALKRGISQTFQIEESELVVEPLPNRENRKSFLFYEASEGGAGVLNRIARDPAQLAMVAKTALEVMHFDLPADRSFAFEELPNFERKRSDENQQDRICEAGCYQCLLSYFNQPDHDLINRQDLAAQHLLVQLANGSVRSSGSAEKVTAESNSDSEKENSILEEWLAKIRKLELREPDQTGQPINEGKWVADAYYRSSRTIVLFSTPDSEFQKYADDRGVSIIHFPENRSDWPSLFERYSTVFGGLQSETTS